MDENNIPLMEQDDFKREEHFQALATEAARRGVIKAKRAGLPLLRPNGNSFSFKSDFGNEHKMNLKLRQT